MFSALLSHQKGVRLVLALAEKGGYMWFDGERRPNTQYVLSLSYGKDSMASIHVIKDILKWPLDRIVTADIWATDTISASLPPVEAFKHYADKWILDNYGIAVEHFCAEGNYEPRGIKKVSYESYFYRKRREGCKFEGALVGFPMQISSWCKKLKTELLNMPNHLKNDGSTVAYIGIAADEPARIARHMQKKDIVLPLVQADWQEDMCGLWCQLAGCLSPAYENGYRDGCWFCHNQPIDSLRRLRHDYPDLWALLLKLDCDSPTSFHPDGHTVHDFDRRFQMEDDGLAPIKGFRWVMLDAPPGEQISLF